MSLPKPSGLKAPGSKIGRPSGLPTAAGAPKSGIPAPSAIPSKAQSPESDAGSLSTDDYKIGDRVWVSGTKPGIIAFIGETQFAPGDWAGVVLDEPIGKNDGSVMGVRYFQCEMKRGVFSRLTKLTRTQQLSRPESVNDVNNAYTAHNNNATTNGMSNSITTSPTPTPPPGPSPNPTPAPGHPRPTTPRLGLGGSNAPSGSSSSLHKVPPSQGAANTAMNVAAARAGLKIGDRVLVSGSKAGALKYVGETDFAKGIWAGVELDEALGKNDGAVAGKRYFECKPLYGLFAPVHKVTRLGTNPMSLSTPSPMSRSLGPGGLRSARERSGSQESVSSISSSASSVSRSRVRLGVTSLAKQNTKVGQRPSTLTLSATTTALQKALKEKEEHIEQLLRERDLERSEVARAAAQVDEAEGQLSNIKSEQERFRGDAEDLIVRLKTQVSQLETEKEELTTKLEDEQRRVEDLQFQIEEETICKDDLETTKEEDEVRLRELEKNHGREKRRADALEKELEALKVASAAQQSQLREQGSTQVSYQDQVEELTHKLTQAESRIQQFQNSRLQEGAKSSQVSVELMEKSAKISELEELVQSQRKDLKMTQDTLQEVREELAASNSRSKKLQESMDGLSSKLQTLEAQHSQANDELRSARSQSSDLQRQLTASQEKSAELLDDRDKLGQQVAELMKNSGDSSNQLSALNLQLADKTRKVEELQSDLLSSSQQIAKLREGLEETQRVQSRQREEIVHTLEDQLNTAHSQLEDLQCEVEKARNKLSKATEEAERERREEVGRKEVEIETLRGRVTALTEDVEKQQTHTQATKDVLDRVTLDMDTMKFEKEKAEKGLKRAEGERDSMNKELIQAQVEVSRLQTQGQEMTQQCSQLTEQIDDLKAHNERLLKAKQEVERQREDIKGDREKVAADRDRVQEQWVTMQAEMQKRDIQMDEMQKEMDRLRRQIEEKQEEVMQRSQTEADMLTEELGEWKKNVESSQALLKERETELARLKASVDHTKVTDTHRQQLEEERAVMVKEMEQLKESHRRELAAAEAERVSLSNRVNSSDQETHHQQQLLEQQKLKLASLEAERQELRAANTSLQSEGHSRQAQTKALAEKVNRLEMALQKASGGPAPASAPTVASGDQRESQLLQDRHAAEQQVGFLNSVIVDLQRKNQDMEHRLHTMESAMFNGDEEAMAGGHSRPAPRLFCDICDMFDLHDTDDCPKQAMSDSPPPSHHHGDRHALRPYCDICEYFIDPDAAENHTHSKQLNTFFKQHIGFFSDDDIDDPATKPKQQQTRPRDVSSSESPLSSPGMEDAPDDFGSVQRREECRSSDPGTERFPEPAIPCIVLSDSEDFPCSPKQPPQDTAAGSSEHCPATEEYEENATGMEDDATTKSEDVAGVSHNATGMEDDASVSRYTTKSEDVAGASQNATGIEGDASVSQGSDVLEQEGSASHNQGSGTAAPPQEETVEKDLQPQTTDKTISEQSENTDPAPAEENFTHDTQTVPGSQPAEEDGEPEFVDTLSAPDSAEDSTQEKSTIQPVSAQRQDHDVPTNHHDQPKQNVPDLVSPSHPDTTTSETEPEQSRALQDWNQMATENANKGTPLSTPAKAVGEDCDLPEASAGAAKPVDMRKEKTKTNLQTKEQKREPDSQTKATPKETDSQPKGSKQETRKMTKGDSQVQGDNGSKGKPENKGDQSGEKGKGEHAGREVTDSKGEKREQQQDKAKKRASTGASLGNTPSEDGPPGSERPESCVVS